MNLPAIRQLILNSDKLQWNSLATTFVQCNVDHLIVAFGII